MTIAVDEPPIYDGLLKSDLSNESTHEWQQWFNTLQDAVSSHNNLSNSALTLNPDFHWSRTVGNTPTTSDGEFVEKWNVTSNGSSFTITPTFYTSTTDNANTGSQRYVNVAIPTPGVNDFEIYQDFANKLSKYEDQQIAVSALIKNNNANRHNIKFYVGFDTNNDGTDEFSITSKVIRILDNQKESLTAVFNAPSIITDNQNNTVTLKLLLSDMSAAVDIDIFYIKFEFSDHFTPLIVDHIIEKVRIDNA